MKAEPSVFSHIGPPPQETTTELKIHPSPQERGAKEQGDLLISRFTFWWFSGPSLLGLTCSLQLMAAEALELGKI